jgi:hypothetical protein
MTPHADRAVLASVGTRRQRRHRRFEGSSGRSRILDAVETMIGIAALLVGIGILWLCFALGVFFFTRTGREGMRIQRMEDERRDRQSADR